MNATPAQARIVVKRVAQSMPHVSEYPRWHRLRLLAAQSSPCRARGCAQCNTAAARLATRIGVAGVAAVAKWNGQTLYRLGDTLGVDRPEGRAATHGDVLALALREACWGNPGEPSGCAPQLTPVLQSQMALLLGSLRAAPLYEIARGGYGSRHVSGFPLVEDSLRCPSISLLWRSTYSRWRL